MRQHTSRRRRHVPQRPHIQVGERTYDPDARIIQLTRSLYQAEFVVNRDQGDIDFDTPSSQYLVELHLRHQLRGQPGLVRVEVLGVGDRIEVRKHSDAAWAPLLADVMAAAEAVMSM